MVVTGTVAEWEGWLGTRLPGPGAIYLSQSLRFRRPVKIGDLVVARATVTALDEAKGRVTLATVCEVAGKAVGGTGHPGNNKGAHMTFPLPHRRMSSW